MIRDLEKTDVDECVIITRLNWGDLVADRFNREVVHAFNGMLEWPPHYFVCELNGSIAAYAGMMPSWIMHGIWDFIWINVHPDFKGQRIGSQLTWFRIHEAQRLGATAIHLMTKETEYFKKFGFRRAHHYQGDWDLMVKQLSTVHI